MAKRKKVEPTEHIAPDLETIGVHNGIDYDKLAESIAKAQRILKEEEKNAFVHGKHSLFNWVTMLLCLGAALFMFYNALFVEALSSAWSTRQLLMGLGLIIMGWVFFDLFDPDDKNSTLNIMAIILAVLAMAVGFA